VCDSYRDSLLPIIHTLSEDVERVNGRSCKALGKRVSSFISDRGPEAHDLPYIRHLALLLPGPVSYMEHKPCRLRSFLSVNVQSDALVRQLLEFRHFSPPLLSPVESVSFYLSGLNATT
jgi:hypothetical protein